MVETYPHNIWSRAKWQQERDAARVPAGACPRVSVAAELDRFHMAMANGVSPAAKHAARRLEERVTTYVDSIEAKHPLWSRRVSVQLAERARTIHDDFDKIGRAAEEYNKAIAIVQNSFEVAEMDIEDWLRAGGDTRLESRAVDVLVAGLREVYVQAQRLTYVTDRVERGIWAEARNYWAVMDRSRAPDRLWLERVNDLRVRLKPV